MLQNSARIQCEKVQQWLLVALILRYRAILIVQFYRGKAGLDPRDRYSGFRRIKMRKQRPGAVIVNNGSVSPVSQELELI